MIAPQTTAAKPHVLTVALEDYFQVGAFNRFIQRGQWYRFEPRLERNTLRALDLLDRFGAKATFFILGWVADQYPELVRAVAARGHEIASKGYYHRSIRQMTPEEFRDDLERSREALERAARARVLGYRVADAWFGPEDLWALDVLAEAGYAYDSSVGPIFRRFAHEPWRRFLHRHRAGDRELWEVPFSSWDVFGWHVPIAGGNYFRQFPHRLVKRAVARWDRTYRAPFVMYFHVWELDPEQPKLSAASLLSRVRHYRNLDKMSWVLEYYFRRYRFTGAADYLGLSTALGEDRRRQLDASLRDRPVITLRPHRDGEDGPPARPPAAPAGKGPVTVVVPCYNEELILPYLANTLRRVQESLSEDYDLRFVFVDDCSADGTYDALTRAFGGWPNARVVRHERNLGVAGAIRTGIREADSEIVCSIDCDCTYDPHELANMIPLLRDGVDLVTASPYHPQGLVRNVPGWRLSLSKASSFLYRRVLRQKLFTYTSCFRVYRRSAFLGLDVRENGYLGVAEMLAQLDLQRGSAIVEYPAVLEARMLGRSKMKVLRTIVGHLRLLRRLAWLRVSGKAARPAAPPAAGPADPIKLIHQPARTSA